MSEPRTKTSTEHQPALSPDMVGFRLLKLTNLLSRPFFGKFAKQHELTLNEWRTMVVLAAQPGSAAQDVAAATGLYAMNISRAVAGLRAAGRLEEARDPDNHRRTLLWLTKAGEKTYREIAPTSEQQAARLLDTLTAAEITTLARIVDKLVARAEEIVGNDE
ncbi:MAG TPA: MarR family winged helix-turn-helix transcriptional regulator [Ramlibacter sp.]|nr:MarR family winged helix-turn-helix transcriptional regulator [Ramlibacter sp.]